LWGLPTAPLAREMVAAGLDARIVAVDTSVMPRDAIGRSWDAAFLDALPPNVDPCGENGEFHTFVCGGPMFRNSIPVTAGALREEGSFLFADLLPV
jgi:diphthamide synthase (EF-2-diphthine--ammonia ligase)